MVPGSAARPSDPLPRNRFAAIRGAHPPVDHPPHGFRQLPPFQVTPATSAAPGARRPVMSG